MNNIKIIVLGGGCFWCTEAVFKMMDGIESVEAGYAGGEAGDPTYEDVAGGNTGHAEVIKIEYDSDVVQLDKLLELFFASHDPTTLDRQGNDVGNQYRSIILCNDQEQLDEVESYLDSIRSEYSEPIVTEVDLLDQFYPAEDYHQDYFKKNPDQAYCQLVIAPKVKKAKEMLGQ